MFSVRERERFWRRQTCGISCSGKQNEGLRRLSEAKRPVEGNGPITSRVHHLHDGNVIIALAYLLVPKDGVINLQIRTDQLAFHRYPKKPKIAHHDPIDAIVFVRLHDSLFNSIPLSILRVECGPNLLQYKIKAQTVALLLRELCIEPRGCSGSGKDPHQLWWLGKSLESLDDLVSEGFCDRVSFEQETFARGIRRHGCCSSRSAECASTVRGFFFRGGTECWIGGQLHEKKFHVKPLSPLTRCRSDPLAFAGKSRW